MSDAFYVIKRTFKMRERSITSPMMQKIDNESNCLLAWESKANAEAYLEKTRFKKDCLIVKETYKFYEKLKAQHAKQGIKVKLKYVDTD